MGLQLFLLHHLMMKKNVAKPEVTDIYVNNKPLNLPYSAANVKSLTLKYNENNLTFYCSTMNYVYAPACKIKYQLKGADKTYKINKNASLPINYVNMAPGKYEFEVYACNNNDQWNSHPRKNTDYHITTMVAFPSS